MDPDLDMDMDYDDVQGTQTQSAPLVQSAQPIDEVARPDSPLASSTLVRNKVHLMGLDAFSSSDIRAFVSEHHPAAPFDRIEWINDTSANLVYMSEAFATEALLALSIVPIEDASAIPPGESVDAKPFSAKPDMGLRVRFAVLSDRKVPGASTYSRYYLLHPEDDPEERRRRREDKHKYRRRDGADRRHSDRGQADYSFDASMYDDPDDPVDPEDTNLGHGAATTDRGQGYRNRSESYERRQRNQEKELFRNFRTQDRELFTSRRSGYGGSRDRSLSPDRPRDRCGVSEDSVSRLRSPPSQNKARAKQIRGRQRDSKELFPNKLSLSGKSQLDQADEVAQRLSHVDVAQSSRLVIKGAAGPPGSSDTGFSIKGREARSAKELFPDRLEGNSGKELFADKLEGRGMPRRKAVDSFQ